jgi:hypothetical protein
MNSIFNRLKSIFVILLLLSTQCTRSPEHPAYLFSYFIGNGEDGLHLAYSHDGINWKALKQGASFLTPHVGVDRLMRDPCIIQGPRGTFHMVWTVSWGEKGIGYAHSNDLIQWSEQQYLPVMEDEPNAKNCWAPEIFYDDSARQFIIFWATTIPGKFPETDNQSSQGPPAPGYNHRIYYVTTKNFKSYSKTRLFYDHGFNVIDATLVPARNRFVMFLKDESNKPFAVQKNIRIATSPLAEGPYGPPSEPITGKDWAEGPTVIKIGSRWHLYFDKYISHHYGLMVSEDMISWTDLSQAMTYPEGMRHGTVFKVSESVLNNLLTQ